MSNKQERIARALERIADALERYNRAALYEDRNPNTGAQRIIDGGHICECVMVEIASCVSLDVDISK